MALKILENKGLNNSTLGRLRALVPQLTLYCDGSSQILCFFRDGDQ